MQTCCYNKRNVHTRYFTAPLQTAHDVHVTGLVVIVVSVTVIVVLIVVTVTVAVVLQCN